MHGHTRHLQSQEKSKKSKWRGKRDLHLLKTEDAHGSERCLFLINPNSDVFWRYECDMLVSFLRTLLYRYLYPPSLIFHLTPTIVLFHDGAREVCMCTKLCLKIVFVAVFCGSSGDGPYVTSGASVSDILHIQPSSLRCAFQQTQTAWKFRIGEFPTRSRTRRTLHTFWFQFLTEAWLLTCPATDCGILWWWAQAQQATRSHPFLRSALPLVGSNHLKRFWLVSLSS